MPEQELEYVGFWPRVWASLIDTVLVSVIVIPLLAAVYGWSYAGGKFSLVAEGPASFFISYVVPAIAVIIFWIYRQATPGKMAISARIVDAQTGLPPSKGQAIGRYLAYYVSILPFCLGLLWVAFDRRKQGWHDKLAGTVVVRPKVRGTEPVRFDKAQP
jgi:uncharacterized RDD family membrane protein YckC